MEHTTAGPSARRRRDARWWTAAVLMVLGGAAVLAGCIPQPPPKTTTTTTTTSTTTTTVPPAPEEGFDFEQASTLLTGPGQSVEVRLGHFGAEGTPDETPVPAATTYEVLGDTGAFGIEELPGGGYRVTSTDQVGGVVVAARVPGQLLAVTADVFSARPQPDAQLVADADVVYPVPNLPDPAMQTTIRTAEITDEGVGPFGWDEIRSRVWFPTDPGTPAETVDDLVDPGEAITPFVLRGPAPAPGTKLLGSGGSGLAGVVVEQPGFPSLTRDGYSLVAVRAASLSEMYGEVRWDVEHESLMAAGVVPASVGVDYACPPEADPADCGDPADAEVVTTVQTPAGPQRGRAAGSPGVRSGVTASSIRAQADDPGELGTSCEASWGASIAQLKVAEVKVVVTPRFAVSLSLGNSDPTLDRVFLYAGYYSRVDAGVSGKLQAQLSAGIGCMFKQLGAIDYPIPAGPAVAVLSARIKAQLIGRMGIELEGGPQVDFEFKCFRQHVFRIGFDAKWDPVEGRLGRIDPIEEDEKDQDCTPTPGAGLGVNSEGVVAKVAVEAGAYLKIPFGFQAGGKLADAWAIAFDDPDLGFIEMAAIEAGPKASVQMETDARALQGRKAESQARLEAVVKFSLGGAGLSRISRGLGLGPDRLASLLNLEILSGSVPLASLQEPLSAAGDYRPDVFVDGAVSAATVEVAEDEVLRVEALIPSPPIGPAQSLESASLWVARSAFDYRKIDEVQLTTSGLGIEGEGTITDAACDDIGEEAVDAIILGQTSFLGTALDQPAYGGSFSLRCVEPGISFDRASVDFRADQTDFPATVNLRSTRLPNEEWRLVADSVPSWLNPSPVIGQFGPEQEFSQPVTLEVDCEVAGDEEVSTDLVAEVERDGGALLEQATVTVTADCRDTFLHVEPAAISAPASGGTYAVDMDTFGPTVVYWPPAGGDWASLSHPDNGVLQPGLTGQQLTVTVAEQPPSCDPRARSTNLVIRTEPRVEGDTTARGAATIRVQQEAGPKLPNCTPSVGGTWGDPHLESFDGASFGAQTFGEYWLVEPLEGGPDLTVQTRHERWTQDGFGSTATITTGVAARVDGHLFEVYTRSYAAPLTLVKVDGEPVSLVPDVPVEVDDGLTLVAGTNRWKIVGPSGTVSLLRWAGEDLMNVHVTLPEGAPVRGLIGTPDGDMANDLVGRDGTQYELRDLRLHGDDLVAFAASWRNTDPARSMFTEPYDGFDGTIALFDPADLDATRDEAAAWAEGIDAICDTGTPEDRDYLIDSVAVELLAGTPEFTFAEAACRYQVSGKVTSTLPDGSVVPVTGLQIRLSEPRLETCETVTGSTGEYSCLLRPIAPDQLPEAGGPPVDVDLEATWPGRPGTVLSDTASFDALATIASTASNLVRDLSIDPSALVRVDVSGVLRADLDGLGLQPVLEDTKIQLVARDAAGQRLADLVTTVQPDGSGAYELQRYLPGGTVEVDVVAQLGSIASEWPTDTVEVGAGSNTVAFDVDHRPPLAVVSGTLLDAADQPLGRTPIRIAPLQGTTSLKAVVIYVTPAPDGTYRVVTALPAATTSYRATAQVGVTSADHRSETFDGVTAGVNELQLDVRYDPPVVRVSGTLVDHLGAPLPATRLVVRPYDGSGGALPSRTVVVTPGPGGTVSADVAVPLSAARATVQPDVGVVAADGPVFEVTGLEPGPNPIDVSLVYDPPRLDLGGVLLDGAGAPRGLTSLTIEAYGPGGSLLRSSGRQVLPSSVDGSYALNGHVLPVATERAVVKYRVGPTEADWPVLTIEPVVAGSNARVFDVDLRATTLLIDGTMSGGAGLPLGITNLRVYAFDADTPLGSFSKVVVPAPPDGAFSTSVEVPRATTRVVLEARVGLGAVDWITQEVTGVQPGPNQVEFVVDHRTPWADLSGTMVGTDPVTGEIDALDGPQVVQAVARDAEGDVVHDSTYVVGINPVDGSYTLPVALPRVTDSLTVTARVGEVSDEWTTTTVTGFTPGVRRSVPFDVEYAATMLDVSGTVRLGGEPYTGPIRVRVAEQVDGLTVLVRDVSTTADATGAYRATRVLRLATTGAEVTVTPLQASGAARSVQVDDLQPGRQVVPLSIDSSTTELALSGRLVLFDEVASGEVQLLVRSYDAGGSELVPGGEPVTVEASGPFGSFDTVIPLDTATRRAVVSIDVDRPAGTVTIASPSYTIGANQRTVGVFDTRGSVVQVDATFTVDGAPASSPVSTISRVLAADGSVLSEVFGSTSVDPTGRAVVEAFVPYPTPAGEEGTDPRYAEFEFLGPAEPVRYQVELGAPDVYRRTATIELSTELRQVTLNMPPLEDHTVTFSAYRIPGDGEEPATRLSEVTIALGPLDAFDGSSYVFDLPVPVTATHLEIDVERLDAARVVELLPDAGPVDLALPVGLEEVVVQGRAAVSDNWACGINAGRPLPFRITAFMGQVDPGDGSVFGTLLHDGEWVFPEADGTYSFRTWVTDPAATQLDVQLDSDGYGIFVGPASTGASVPLSGSPGDSQTVDLDLVGDCNIFG